MDIHADNAECSISINADIPFQGILWYTSRMKNRHPYSVLAIYSLEHKSGREHFAGILDEMSDKNWRLRTISPERFTAGELSDGNGEPYDGLILSMPGTDEAMKLIARSDTPTVLVNIADRRLSAQRTNLSFVWTDNADIGHLAARHLLERGEYKSVGFVYGLPEFYADERMRAFRETMKRNGYETTVFAPDSEPPSGTNAPAVLSEDYSNRLRRWLKELPKPTAIMAVADMRAATIINICREEGMAVPSQVSVIGSDYDVSQHERCGMSISSIGTNARLMGRQAVRELDFLFRHPNWKGRPHEVLIPAKEVFVGESTARSVSAARLVKMAMDYISENRKRDISPSDVAAHLGCSRSLAELRFAQVRGTTMRMAIENVRLAEADRRLQNGESVGDIVRDMRFTSANQFYRIYKRHFGRTVRGARQP